MHVDVRIDKALVQKFLEDLEGQPLKRAVARAINRTATSTRANIAKRIRAQVNIKARDIKEAIEISKRASPRDGLRAFSILQISGRATPLQRFDARTKQVRTPAGKRVGVTVKVKQTRKIVKGAFVMKNSAGAIAGVFKRIGAARGRIKKLYSTSILDIMRNEGVVQHLASHAQETFAKNFEHELQFQLSKSTKQ